MERVLRIERLIHGGDGLARIDGQVVFVPLVAAGDLVRVRVPDVMRGTPRAELVEVLEPGPTRVVPPCPLVGRCGGCDRQQVSLDGQLEAKRDAVADSLTRIGGLGTDSLRPLVPSPKPFRYRRRMRAHLAGDGWGFRERAGHRVARAETCLLIEEEVERFANALAPAMKRVGLHVESFSLDAESGRAAAHLELLQKPDRAAQATAAKLLSLVPGLRGVVLSGAGGAPAMVGDPVLIDQEHHRLRVRPDLFTQANRQGARLLSEHVAATIEPGSAVLELFAGTGTLSLAIAERTGTLIATEGAVASLNLLRTALAEGQREARLIGGPAPRVSEQLLAEGTPVDHVVLDPPRAGAKEALAAIAKLKPRRITYVSCDPATFARDAGTLTRAGFALAESTPYDLFPQTHHVEVVAVFERA